MKDLSKLRLPERYLPLRSLGEGGMGAVVLAEDLELGREVAVKVLHERASPDTRRLLQEARGMASLEHPGLARVYDVETEGPQPYLVMEYIPGRDLAEVPPPDPLAAMLEVGQALAALHAAGLLHRDVKPSNLLLSREGRVVLVDLGLVQISNQARLTLTGELVGTPAFLAPELLLGEDASPASDWYAWGVTLHCLVDGNPEVFPNWMAWAAGGPEPTPRPLVGRPPGSPEARVIEACTRVEPDRRPRNLRAIRLLVEAPREEPGGPAAPTEALTLELPGEPHEPAPAPPEGSELRKPPPSGRGRLLLPWAVLLLGGLLTWSWSPRASGPSPSPAAPSPSATPSLDAAWPPALPRDLGERLHQEWLDALVAPFPLRVRGAPENLAGLEAAHRELGALALDALPQEGAVLDWLQGAGPDPALPSALREALEAHDQDLATMGAAPVFAALLPRWDTTEQLAAPLPLSPDHRNTLQDLDAVFGESGEGPAGSWYPRARHHLARCLLGLEDLEEELSRESSGMTRLFSLGKLGPIRAAWYQRDRRPGLRRLLAPCQASARAFLMASYRALSHLPGEGPPDTIQAFEQALERIAPALLPDMIGAGRRRLFAPEETPPLARTLVALTLRQLRHLRQSQGIGPDLHAEEELRAWEDFLLVGEDKLARSALERYLGSLLALDQGTRLESALVRHRRQLGQISQRRLEELREAAHQGRAGAFSPDWIPAPD